MTNEKYSLLFYTTALIVISPHVDEVMALFIASSLLVLGTFAFYMFIKDKNK